MHFNDIINAVLNGLAEFRFQDFIDIVIITVIYIRLFVGPSIPAPINY